MTIDVQKASIDHMLSGTSATILKIEECFAQTGRPDLQGPVFVGTAATNDIVPRDSAGNTIENDAYRMGMGCPRVGTMRSPASDIPAQVEFRHGVADGTAVSVYWLDFNGEPVEMAGLFSLNPVVSLNTYVGHKFIAKDIQGTCHGGVITVGSGRTAYVIR